MATGSYFGVGLASLFEAQVGFLVSPVRAMLCTSSYTPLPDVHRFRDQVLGEISGTGYSAGGVTLTNKSVTYIAGTKTLRVDASDPTWPAASFTARYLIFYIDSGDPATSPLLSYVDFGSNQSPVNQTFTYQIPSQGIVELVLV